MRKANLWKTLTQASDLKSRNLPERNRPNCKDEDVGHPSKIKEMAGTALDTDVEKTTRDELSKQYHVIILNDDEHTFDYVIEMLQAIFNLPYATAFARTVEADATGSSIVYTTSLEEAERKRDQVHAYGPDWRLPRSRGSVAALVEPAA